jgi:hypothetical protein
MTTLEEDKEESQTSKQEDQELSLDPIKDSMCEDQEHEENDDGEDQEPTLDLIPENIEDQAQSFVKAKYMRKKMMKHVFPLKKNKISLKSQLLMKIHLFHPPHHFMKKGIMLQFFLNLTVLYLSKNLKKSYV